MTFVRTYRERLVAPAMVFGGLLLVPWILYLAGALPHSTRARNWSLMWTGLDIAEALGLVLTGVLLWRRSPYRALPAAFTSALLAADAWIDVTTSAPGHAKALAITMAALVEVPAAIGCLVLSVRAFPRAPAAGARRPAGSARSKAGPARRKDSATPRRTLRQPRSAARSTPDAPARL